MNDPCVVRFKKLENKMNHMRGCSATMHVHARDRGNVTVLSPQALLVCSSNRLLLSVRAGSPRYSQLQLSAASANCCRLPEWGFCASFDVRPHNLRP